jgi:hypothetical protein
LAGPVGLAAEDCETVLGAAAAVSWSPPENARTTRIAAPSSSTPAMMVFLLSSVPSFTT